MTVAEILEQEFNTLKTDLLTAYTESGMRVSGEWGDQLEVRVANNEATLMGAEYSEQLETGRRPGKQPPSDAIKQWILNKGIAARLENKISVSSLAYLIARKIAREGWKPKQETDILRQVITPERMQQITDRVGDACITEFSTTIINYLQP